MTKAPNIVNQDYENYDYLKTLETGSMTPKTKTSSLNGSQIAGYTLPAVGALIGMAGTYEDRSNENEALMQNMGNQAESLLYSQGVTSQKLDDLDRVLGDKLSASGLEAMKTESRLKAASAETGGTGGSNQDAINTAGVNKLHRDAALFKAHDTQKANTQSQMIANRLNFENEIESMISSQQSALSAGLETFGAGLQGLNLGMRFLSGAGKEAFFGTNITGNKG